MAWDDLTAEERAELVALLRQAVDGDGYPLSPRVRRRKPILEKLAPLAALPGEAYPAPRRSAEPSHLYAKLRGRRRR
jgi:hypothetical protein